MVRGKQSSYYIANARVIDPSQNLDQQMDVLIENGNITAIDKPGVLKKKANDQDVETIDAKNWVLAPGFIDLNARMGEPGSDPVEAMGTSSRAAAAGGFTSVLVRPSYANINDNAFMTDYISRHASEKSLVRIFPMGALTLGSRGETLAEIGSMVEAGVIAVGDDLAPIMNSYLMRKALEYVKAFQVPIFSFTQDENLVGKGVMEEGFNSCRLGLRGIPAAAEEIMIRRDITLAEHTDGNLHITTVTTAGSVRALREAKKRGLKITAEANPQYFSLTSDEIKTYDANYKFFPPLRSQKDLNAVIDAIADGTIDVVASMHQPQSPGAKDMVFEHAAPGMISFETTFPLLLSLVRAKKITLSRAIDLVSCGPAKILKLDERGLGSIKTGNPADLVLFDLEKQYTYEEAMVHSVARNSPFIAQPLQGAIMRTLRDGMIVSRGLFED